MPVRVLKFGGTSVGTPRRLQRAAEQVARLVGSGESVAVVISAMGHSTDRLLSRAQQVHRSAVGRELDALLASGEQVSASLLALALDRLGIAARSLVGAQIGLRTDSRHGGATIMQFDPRPTVELLDRGVVPVVAGYHGVDAMGDLTTLGRGGSDTTAVALAAAIAGTGREVRCEILTDVPGVFTADPRLVPDARRIAHLSGHAMLAMARAGAQVMHPPAVAHGLAAGVPILVRLAHRPGVAGTWIEPRLDERSGATAVARRADVGSIIVAGLPPLDRAILVAGLRDLSPLTLASDSPDGPFVVPTASLERSLSLAHSIASSHGATVVASTDVSVITLIGDAVPDSLPAPAGFRERSRDPWWIVPTADAVPFLQQVHAAAGLDRRRSGSRRHAVPARVHADDGATPSPCRST